MAQRKQGKGMLPYGNRLFYNNTSPKSALLFFEQNSDSGTEDTNEMNCYIAISYLLTV